MTAPEPSGSTTSPVSWGENDTPIAMRFDDPYYSRLDGRAEARHVFIGGNRLDERFARAESFGIGELGFGTGLNFFETLALWRRAAPVGAVLTYVAFERYPLPAEDLARALSPWPDLGDDCRRLLEHWPPGEGWHDCTFGPVRLRLGIGDANALVPAWTPEPDGADGVEAWYLDGFSPAKNPDMWGDALLADVFRHTREGGTFATFTAAGWVRRNLIAAGFAVSKIPGFGRKRECLSGVRPVATGPR